MTPTHDFTVAAVWRGGLEGRGQVSTEGFSSPLSVPQELKGPGRGNNPEQLIVAAAASCYLMTLGIMLDKRGLAFEKLELSSRGSFVFNDGLKLNGLTHHLRLTVAAGATPEHHKAVHAVAALAESRCMVARALHGNVQIELSTELVTDKAESAHQGVS